MIGLTQEQFTQVIAEHGAGFLTQVIMGAADAELAVQNEHGKKEYVVLGGITVAGVCAVLQEEDGAKLLQVRDGAMTVCFAATKHQLLDLVNAAERAIQHMNDVEEVRAAESPRDITDGGLVLPFTKPEAGTPEGDDDPGAEPREGA